MAGDRLPADLGPGVPDEEALAKMRAYEALPKDRRTYTQADVEEFRERAAALKRETTGVVFSDYATLTQSVNADVALRENPEFFDAADRMFDRGWSIVVPPADLVQLGEGE